MSGVPVVVLHDDPSVLRALVGSVEASADLYVAGTEITATAGVLVAGGRALERLRAPLAVPLVALAEDGDEIRAARAALAIGAREIVRWPHEAFRLPGALQLVAAQRDASAGSLVLAVVGARGGVGTSSAVLAFAIESSGIAIDLGGGGLAIVATDQVSLAPITVVAADVIEGALQPLIGGARVLSHLRVPADRVGIVAAARGLAATVLVDAGREAALTAGADRMVIACADDVASVRGVRRLVEAGVRPDLLLLRRERRDGVAARDLAAVAGSVPCMTIPRDRALGRALDLGRWPARPTRGVRAFGSAWRALTS